MLVSSALISGLGLGSMYGLLALGFHVTHAASNTVNFAQGSAMMLGAVLCFTFWVTFQWLLTLAVIAALALCAVWGSLVERIGVRPFVRRGSNAWLMATVALGIVLENVVLFTFGKDPRGMPPGVLTTGYVIIAGVRVQYLQVLIPVIGLLLAAGLQMLFATSRHGKALLASRALDRDLPPVRQVAGHAGAVAEQQIQGHTPKGSRHRLGVFGKSLGQCQIVAQFLLLN